MKKTLITEHYTMTIKKVTHKNNVFIKTILFSCCHLAVYITDTVTQLILPRRLMGNAVGMDWELPASTTATETFSAWNWRELLFSPNNPSGKVATNWQSKCSYLWSQPRSLHETRSVFCRFEQETTRFVSWEVERKTNSVFTA